MATHTGARPDPDHSTAPGVGDHLEAAPGVHEEGGQLDQVVGWQRGGRDLVIGGETRGQGGCGIRANRGSGATDFWE